MKFIVMSFAKDVQKDFLNKFKDKTSENVITIDEILKSLKTRLKIFMLWFVY